MVTQLKSFKSPSFFTSYFSKSKRSFFALRPLHITKIFTKIFLKKLLGKSLSIYKTVEKIVAVVKKVVVCMDDNYFFCSFSFSVRGP